MIDEEVQQLLKVPVISRPLAFEERMTVNPQVSLLDLILAAGIQGDVMWLLIDGKHIVYVPHYDGLLVDRVDDDMDEEIDGMAANIAMRLKEVTLAVLDRITREVKQLSELE